MCSAPRTPSPRLTTSPRCVDALAAAALRLHALFDAVATTHPPPSSNLLLQGLRNVDLRMSRALDFVEEVEALSYVRPHVTTSDASVAIKFSSSATASRFFVTLSPSAAYPFEMPRATVKVDFGAVRLLLFFLLGTPPSAARSSRPLFHSHTYTHASPPPPPPRLSL